MAIMWIIYPANKVRVGLWEKMGNVGKSEPRLYQKTIKCFHTDILIGACVNFNRTGNDICSKNPREKHWKLMQEVKIFLAAILTASLARQVEVKSRQERTQRLRENVRKAPGNRRLGIFVLWSFSISYVSNPTSDIVELIRIKSSL